MPAALGPDAPTDVSPPAATRDSAAMDGQNVEVPAAVAPLEPAIPAVSPPPVAPVRRWPGGPRTTSHPAGRRPLAAERPEIAVGAAFAGGLVLALILKRLAR